MQLFSSTALIEELADVLTRPSPAKQLAAINQSPHEVITDYLAIVQIIEPHSVPRVVPTDPDDDQVIACAVAAQADLIVSGDRDLLGMESFQETPINSAAKAVEVICTASGE